MNRSVEARGLCPPRVHTIQMPGSYQVFQPLQQQSILRDMTLSLALEPLLVLYKTHCRVRGADAETNRKFSGIIQ
jgi:hypothetical protein